MPDLRTQTLRKARYEPDEKKKDEETPDFSDVQSGTLSQPHPMQGMVMPAMAISGAMPGQVQPQTQAAPGAEPQPPAPPQAPPAPGPSYEELQALQQHLAGN